MSRWLTDINTAYRSNSGKRIAPSGAKPPLWRVILLGQGRQRTWYDHLGFVALGLLLFGVAYTYRDHHRQLAVGAALLLYLALSAAYTYARQRRAHS